MAYQWVGVCDRVHGTIIRRSNHWHADSRLARRRNRIFVGDWNYISKCLAERQIPRCLDCQIPETFAELAASNIGKRRSIYMGNRVKRTFNVRANRHLG